MHTSLDKNQAGLIYIKSPVFEDIKGFSHGFFSRQGGISKEPFDFLNVSFDVGDAESDVITNRKLILDEFGFGKMVSVHQVHGVDSFIPKPFDGAYGEHCMNSPDADIIITDNPGQLIMVKTADCQPVILTDEEKRVCAVVHSGWRGSVQNVICRAVDKMIEKYSCVPGNIKAAVGPALGSCCAEFKKYRKEIPEEFWDYRVGEYNFDFKAISVFQLVSAGLKKKNIWVDKHCTKCNNDKYFSYRNKKVTGRQASVAGWLHL
ncbi:MAG: peptidoglycan editing factor PgeF [Thermodesulfobacteriota bacterium]